MTLNVHFLNRFKVQLLVHTALLFLVAMAAPPVLAEPKNCKSCLMVVDSLQKPYDLRGQWLFTRDDHANNKLPSTAVDNWVTVSAMGSWKSAYNDGENFTVGWYRGHFRFDESLIGTEVILLLDAYMSKLDVYLDGDKIYHRGETRTLEPYYSIQAIPVRFTITKPNHTLAIRINSIIMKGMYQVPFKLKAFDPSDKALALQHVLTGPLKVIIVHFLLLCGIFFVIFYFKIKSKLYLYAGLTCITIYVFTGFPSNFYLKLFDPHRMFLLHYIGNVLGTYCILRFCLHVTKWRPIVAWTSAVVYTLCIVAFITINVSFNHDLFLLARTICFLYTFSLSFIITYAVLQSVWSNRESKRYVLAVGVVIYISCGTNDILVAFGLIESITLTWVGVAALTLCITLYTASEFANTFVDNGRLVNELGEMNTNLERFVEERTEKLRQKTAAIRSIFESIPEGIFTIDGEKKIQPEYSNYLEKIIGDDKVVGKSIRDVVFTHSNLSEDQLSAMDASIDCIIDQDILNYEFNRGNLPNEIVVSNSKGHSQNLELTWAPIADEDDTIESLMIALRDVTSLRKMQAAAAHNQREIDIVTELIASSPTQYSAFSSSNIKHFAEIDQAIASIDKDFEECIKVALRNLHTVKGNARTYRYLTFSSVVHEAEDLFISLSQNNYSTKMDEITVQLEAIRTLAEEYQHVNDHVLGRSQPEANSEQDLYTSIPKNLFENFLSLVRQAKDGEGNPHLSIANATCHFVEQIESVDLKTLLLPITESLPSLAQDLGKESPHLKIEDNNIRFSHEFAKSLESSFSHLIKNSLDHGIETKEERAANHKPPRASIDIRCEIIDECCLIHFKDDGAGLNISRIRDMALEKGLINAEQSPSDIEIAECIFAPGFSTTSAVTDISGRGVGMDAVRAFLNEKGAKIRIELGAQLGPHGFAFEFIIETSQHYIGPKQVPLRWRA